MAPGAKVGKTAQYREGGEGCQDPQKGSQGWVFCGRNLPTVPWGAGDSLFWGLLEIEDVVKVIARNKQAHREYQIQDKLEAGLSLRGTEVKSIRLGHVQLSDAYVQIINGEAFLVKANISVYDKGSWTNHEPSRRRKLLLHKREIRKLQTKINEKGLTVVPLQMYLNDKGLVKVEIGVGKGKQFHDKREDLKRRDAARDIQREMRRGNHY